MLGQGVYTLPEVALYTGVPVNTLRNWFIERADRPKDRVFESPWPRIDDSFAVSFVNLIEAYVASFFRENGVKRTDIRKTNRRLKTQLKTLHPFATENLSTHLGVIIHEETQAGGDKQYTEVLSRQLSIPQFKDGMKRIVYDVNTKLASSWHIHSGVFISPKIGFGKPVVDGSGVSTFVLGQQYLANHKNVCLVSKLFSVTEASVRSAIEFERKIGRIAAAA